MEAGAQQSISREAGAQQTILPTWSCGGLQRASISLVDCIARDPWQLPAGQGAHVFAYDGQHDLVRPTTDGEKSKVSATRPMSVKVHLLQAFISFC